MMVWKASKTFGLGFAINTANNNTVDIVMNTSPPGNVRGDFAANVLPAISPITPPVPPIVPPVVVPTPPTLPIPPITPPTPPSDNNHVHNMMSLYKILNDVITNRPKYIIVAELKQLIKDMSTQG